MLSNNFIRINALDTNETRAIAIASRRPQPGEGGLKSEGLKICVLVGSLPSFSDKYNT